MPKKTTKTTKTKKPTKSVNRTKKLPKDMSKLNSDGGMKLWLSVLKHWTKDDETFSHLRNKTPQFEQEAGTPTQTAEEIAAEENEMLKNHSVKLESLTFDKDNTPVLTPSISRWILEYNDVVERKSPEVSFNYNEILGVANVFGIPVNNMKKFLMFAVKARGIDVSAVESLNSTLKKTIYSLREIKLKQAKEAANKEAGVTYIDE